MRQTGTGTLGTCPCWCSETSEADEVGAEIWKLKGVDVNHQEMKAGEVFSDDDPQSGSKVVAQEAVGSVRLSVQYQKYKLKISSLNQVSKWNFEDEEVLKRAEKTKHVCKAEICIHSNKNV